MPAPIMVTISLSCWALLCALQDARHKRISNLLTLGPGLLAAGFLYYAGHSLTGSPPLSVLLALALALLLSLPGYLRGQMGAADVKLLATLALASSPAHVLGTLALAALSMLLWVIAGPALWRRLPRRIHQLLPLLAPVGNPSLPYAPFFFCGLLASLLWLG